MDGVISDDGCGSVMWLYVRSDLLIGSSTGFDDCQQMPRPADTHEPGIVVIIGGEILMRRKIDQDDGFRVETFGFVDGGMTDNRLQMLPSGRQSSSSAQVIPSWGMAFPAAPGKVSRGMHVWEMPR